MSNSPKRYREYRTARLLARARMVTSLDKAGLLYLDGEITEDDYLTCVNKLTVGWVDPIVVPVYQDTGDDSWGEEVA